MHRRTLLLLAAILPAFPALAQPARKVFRVGVLSDEASVRYDAFRRGLRELGYVEGRNLVLETQFSKGDVASIAERAAHLVKLKPDVILASSSTYVGPARQATRTIPIVFAVHNDPVGTGDVVSLARPGGNATGLTQMGSDLVAKQLQLLREMKPSVARVAVVWNPGTPSHAPALAQVDAAAKSLRLQLSKVSARTPEEVDTAFAHAAREGADAVFLVLAPVYAQHRRRVAELALRHRLPALMAMREYVAEGGLVSYGPSLDDLYYRAAGYVDRILRGAKPADLPVEQPTKFELAINRKTAAAMGITIPKDLLVRADEIVQ